MAKVHTQGGCRGFWQKSILVAPGEVRSFGKSPYMWFFKPSPYNVYLAAFRLYMLLDYWLGLRLRDLDEVLGWGANSEVVTPYYNFLGSLLRELSTLVVINDFSAVKSKEIYAMLTDPFLPPVVTVKLDLCWTPRAGFLLFRAFSGVLPTRTRLCRMNKVPDKLCLTCRRMVQCLGPVDARGRGPGSRTVGQIDDFLHRVCGCVLVRDAWEMVSKMATDLLCTSIGDPFIYGITDLALVYFLFPDCQAVPMVTCFLSTHCYTGW